MKEIIIGLEQRQKTVEKRETLKEKFIEKDSKGKLIRSWEKEYNDKGKMIEEVEKDSEGKIIRSSKNPL